MSESEELDAEIAAVLAQLTPSQLAAMKGLFGAEEKPTVPRRGIAPKDKIFECEVIIACQLCGTRTPQIFKSASPLPSVFITPTCESCERVLLTKSVEELTKLAILAADRCWAEIKEARNAELKYIAPVKGKHDEEEPSSPPMIYGETE